MKNKSYLHGYKLLKAFQLILFSVLEIFFVVYLYTHKTLKETVFADKNLFTLCLCLYILMALVYVFLIVDFVKIRELKDLNARINSIAYLDRQTGLPNRTGLNSLFAAYNANHNFDKVGICVTEISNIVSINEQYGKERGDEIIRDFTKVFESVGDRFGFVGRNSGNEFVTVIDPCTEGRMKEFLCTLDDEIASYKEATGMKEFCKIHSGYSLASSVEVSSFSELVATAYKSLRA